METLSGILSFVRSAEAGSFSAAARRLSLTPAAVSKNVAKLETDLGVRLFLRSTRSLALTEAGEQFLNEVSAGVATVQGAIANVSQATPDPTGTLKVSLSPAFGLDYLLPVLREFRARYPAVLPDWHFDNRSADLLADRFDAAIGRGIELAPGMVARELAPVHIIAVASPDYVKKTWKGKQRPTVPADLAGMDGIALRSLQTERIRTWSLRNPAGNQATVELQPRVMLNDAGAVCRSAAMGMGIALVATPHALHGLERGELVRLLPDWYADIGPLCLYVPGQKLLPAKTRAFVEVITQHFHQQKLAQRFSATPHDTRRGKP